MNTIIEKLRALIKMQIRREELNFASLGGGGQTMNIGALEWVLKQLDTLQEQPVDWQKVAEAHAKDQPLGQDNDGNLVYLQEHPVWHNVEKETPTSFGEGVIVLCKNKNKEDGIWLTDFIPCWEGEWKPRDNWETPVKWAYVRDFYPKAEQSVTLSVKDAMKALDEKIAKVKKAGSWKNPELLDEMRAEQTVCEDVEMEIKETELEYQQRSERGEYPVNIESICRRFYELGRQSKPKPMEGLEEEIREFVEQEWDGLHDNDGNPLYTADYLEYIARHFAKWGAEHGGSSETPADLEEAAVEYSAIGYSPFDDTYEKHQQFECSKFAFIAGAKWQKEQMLKEAVEGEVYLYHSYNRNATAIVVDIPKENLGDNVRIIICKKED